VSQKIDENQGAAHTVAGADHDRIIIFDTTLRDGEQSPGATLTSKEKLEIARSLARLGVDVMESGFPAASPDDFAAVHAIAAEVGTTVPEGRPSCEPISVCALARATEGDIQKAWDAIKPAKRPRIHTFLATSPIHMEHKLRMSPAQVLKRVDEMVRFAASLCADIEFSAEDAARSDVGFLNEVFAVAIAAGATTLNIPDTVGYTTPEEYAALIRAIRDNTVGAENVVLSTHCHDDLGMAVANTLAGLRAGARQAEVTINGIGERAGNASLEEVVMALRTRSAFYKMDTQIDATNLSRVSRLVSLRTGMMVQPNKAIVGSNAFAHESGIHQDGMLKHEETYEIMRPEDVGATATKLVMGKHSGRHALAVKLRELGYSVEGDTLDQAFKRFKALCDKKKEITVGDLEALVTDERGRTNEAWTLDGLQVASGTIGMPTASVRIKKPDGTLQTHACVGTGPVDAAYKAVDAIMGAPAKLLEFNINAVTEGIDALGGVSVMVGVDEDLIDTSHPERVNPQYGNTVSRVFHGTGADTDILVASVKAYISALSRLTTALEPQPESQTESQPQEAE
jgi:2-isopropylmalate synthase